MTRPRECRLRANKARDRRGVKPSSGTPSVSDEPRSLGPDRRGSSVAGAARRPDVRDDRRPRPLGMGSSTPAMFTSRPENGRVRTDFGRPPRRESPGTVPVWSSDDETRSKGTRRVDRRTALRTRRVERFAAESRGNRMTPRREKKNPRHVCTPP